MEVCWTVTAATADDAEEIVALWRRSFQRAMHLSELDDPQGFADQLAYFRTIPVADVRVVRPSPHGMITGFMVQAGSVVEQLYVHVDWQGQGIGKMLLDVAKAASPTGLLLHTFQANLGAQAFYRGQGFVQTARGQASIADNPWASSLEQLRDVALRWVP